MSRGVRRRYPDDIGDDRVILVEKERQTDTVVAAYLLPKVAAITGAYLEDARLEFDQTQAPIVGFRFNAAGGETFGRMTESNIGAPPSSSTNRSTARRRSAGASRCRVRSRVTTLRRRPPISR